MCIVNVTSSWTSLAEHLADHWSSEETGSTAQVSAMLGEVQGRGRGGCQGGLGGKGGGGCQAQLSHGNVHSSQSELDGCGCIQQLPLQGVEYRSKAGNGARGAGKKGAGVLARNSITKHGDL